MDVKIVLLAFVIMMIALVQADFYSNHPRDINSKSGLKCIPGRTIIKTTESKLDNDSNEENTWFRRSHMNDPGINDEFCQICVCSVEGKDEYCRNRPAKNINECIRMAKLKQRFDRNIPYDLTRNLAYRIRRDYIWHTDEIPYDPKAKCRRGTSYYSNSITATDTDVDVGFESLLDNSDKNICYYCVCKIDGRKVGCISRDPWYCNYYRTIRNEDNPRNRYTKIFQQDRPTYFRQLSYRLRRTMDDGMFSMMQSVGGDTKTCIPFVSEYTDCTDENRCSGCQKCKCDANGQWECQTNTDCLDMNPFELDENTVENAWQSIEGAWKTKKEKMSGQSKSPLVPRPTGSENVILLEEIANLEKKEEDEDVELINRDLLGMIRRKRSVQLSKENSNDTVQIHQIVDETNKNTLKNNDTIGTIEANKFVPNLSSQISRRNGVVDVTNMSTPLHIEYNLPLYDHHITDNKIDTVRQSDDAYNLLDKDQVSKILGNQTQENKDKSLSKLIVNELKKGIEIVGDANAPSISNITFKTENDTLTAMAFIAGNLLNKLWNMEKDETTSVEIDMLKHEKIADLLELFKEPLTIRQENFLKKALEHLSDAIDGNKDVTNVSLCKEMETLKDQDDTTQTDKHQRASNKENNEIKKVTKSEKLKSTEEAIAKINDVLDLMKKYEKVQKNIKSMKQTSFVNVRNKNVQQSGENFNNHFLTDEESTSLNLFGNVLKKITKLLVPKAKRKNIIKSLKTQNILLKSDDLKTKLKRIYNIDLENTTLSTKDKVILDYLSNLRNRNCQINRDKFEDVPSIEGEVLLNLSEFFKVKSFVDLLKLLEIEKSPIARGNIASTESMIIRTTEKIPTTDTVTGSFAEINPVDKLSKTKENLKVHLKIIINDLLELKNDKSLNVADVLPCIYNLLNTDNDVTKVSNMKSQKDPLENIKKMFELMKKGMKYTNQTRRTYIGAEKRPKSAVVWERVIKNLDNRKHLNARRYLKTKSFEVLHKMMEDLESASNSYKNQALMKKVSPNKQLILLKALDANVKQYIQVLEDLKTFMNTVIKLSSEKSSEINEFVDNGVRNIRLNEKVMNSLFKPKEVEPLLTNFPNYKVSISNLKTNEALITQSNIDDKIKSRSKLTREDIIKQLIKNRIQYYLTVKDEGIVNSKDDTNVNIAKKILGYLNSNYNNLAIELYKIFVSRKKPSRFNVVSSKPLLVTTPRSYMMPVKEPLLQFENRR